MHHFEKFLLGGKSDAATVAAIDRFCETLLPYADAMILVNADQHFLVRATYAVEAITLDGYSLGDYRLVYPKENESREREIAQALREAIADRCGFYPEILADSAVSERSRIITVGACFGETFASETRFFATGSHVSLCGGSEHALAAVAQAFCDYLFPADAHGSLAVSIETSVAVKESAPTLSAYTALLHEDDPSVNLTEIVHLADSILAAEPLFVPFGTINPSALSHLQLSLPTYTAHSVLLNTDCALPFFYRGDAMTLLEERVTDGACVLRFSLANTAQTVTVYHATADTQAAADALVQAAAQALTENELCLLFLCTPTDVFLGASTVFDPIGTTDGDNESMHVLLYRPSDLISTTATPPDGADALYSFTLTHPFLRT